MLSNTVKSVVIAAALTAAGATAALADDAAAPTWGSITGSVAFTTDYVFRGLDQTPSTPAVQGFLQYSHPSGVYVSVWMSNADYAPSVKFEIDSAIGLSNTIGKFKYDVGYVYYAYPGAKDNNVTGYTGGEANYYEFYGKGTYDFGVAQLTGSVYGTPNFQFDTGPEIYYNAAANVPLPFLPWNAYASGAIGYTTFLDSSKRSASLTDTVTDYIDWNVGVGVTIPYGGLALDVRYYDTNLSSSITKPAGNSSAQGSVVATLSKSF